VYNTSKAGLTTYLEALRNRIGRYGVRVVTVKPGFVDTEMTHGMSGLFWLISADRAAQVILRKAERGALCAYVPARWRLLMWVIRSIPSFVFRRLKI
jgi:short-subunit dehydrogenase